VNCFSCEYGNSDDDVRNTGNVSAVYDLPFGRGRKYLSAGQATDLLVGGWSVNTLFTARSGLSISVTLSRSATVLPEGNVNQRPDRVPGVPVYMPHRGINSWLNPAAFSVPAAGTWGNVAKNIANGPSLWQDDTTVEKTFRITERNHLILRAEAFNLFNRAQYGQPAAVSTLASRASAPPVASERSPQRESTGLVGTGTPRELSLP
jgi:hypothetical protein